MSANIQFMEPVNLLSKDFRFQRRASDSARRSPTWWLYFVDIV